MTDRNGDDLFVFLFHFAGVGAKSRAIMSASCCRRQLFDIFVTAVYKPLLMLSFYEGINAAILAFEK